ncbi:DNA-directed RNA polymerase subunit beta [Nocardia lijiangensis]|uniref:DNA-directed RNA polymerase subunit beta n=1 Tax=Nocardia lijiangensis TaxID=299618 RepID=UPI00082CB5BD|nr:DNA-directed RNA polymerase subunit beta [Nocardia lijiangensis]
MEQRTSSETPAARCRYYRRTCGLPATLHPEIGRIVVNAGIVWALTMPAALGQIVKTDLQHRQISVGPIISHPRSQRWTFLIRPDLPDEVKLFAELFRLNVSVVRAGGEIALPSPHDQQMNFRRWVEPPREPYRPSGVVIIDSIRRATRRSGSQAR